MKVKVGAPLKVRGAHNPTSWTLWLAFVAAAGAAVADDDDDEGDGESERVCAQHEASELSGRPQEGWPSESWPTERRVGLTLVWVCALDMSMASQ
jgi:hypothetical protein